MKPPEIIIQFYDGMGKEKTYAIINPSGTVEIIANADPEDESLEAGDLWPLELLGDEWVKGVVKRRLIGDAFGDYEVWIDPRNASYFVQIKFMRKIKKHFSVGDDVEFMYFDGTWKPDVVMSVVQNGADYIYGLMQHTGYHRHSMGVVRYPLPTPSKYNQAVNDLLTAIAPMCDPWFPMASVDDEFKKRWIAPIRKARDVLIKISTDSAKEAK